MATQNVKILLRRGLRDEMTTETLHTGEMGFTTDTNQLYVGTDDAINEIQFEPFANAHAIIQSWLDSYELDANGVNIGDCPYPGLDVDEDLVIRLYNNEDVDTILDAMRYFEQEVTLSTNAITFSNGDILYQYFDDEGTVRQRSEGIITGSVDNGDGTTTLTLKVGEREEYNFRGERVIATNVITETINSTTDGVNQLKIYINAQGPNPLYVPAGQLDELFDVTTIEVNNGIDAAYNLTLADADYTVQYMDNTSNEEDTHFLITFANPVQDGKQTQVDIVNTDTHTAPHASNSFPLIENYQTTTPVVEVNSVVQVLGVDYNIVNDNVVFITTPTDDVTIRYEVDVLVNTDQQVTFTVTFDDSDNFWFSMDKNLTSLDTAIKASNITGIRQFQPALYGRARRNVEVITENSFNQQFADQHLTSLDASTGLRSSLNRKTLSTTTRAPGAFVVGVKHVITVLGDVDWNDIAGTTGITYNVGDEITPVKVGDTIIPATYDYTGSNFAIKKWDGSAWQACTPTLLQDAPGTGDVSDYASNGSVFSVGPISTFGNQFDYAVVTSTGTITIWYKWMTDNWIRVGSGSEWIGDIEFGDTQPANPPYIGYHWVDTTELDIQVNGTSVSDTDIETSDNQAYILYNDPNASYYTGSAMQLEGTFLKYNKMICTTFFIDYSLVQKDGVNTFLRAGQLKVINTAPMNTTTNPVLEQTKLSDDNTEVWQDSLGNTSDVAENIEFSNINFRAEIVGEHLHVKYEQDANFETEISYTVKRWSM